MSEEAEKEVWVPVAGIPYGLYEVSSQGCVRSVTHKGVDSVGRPFTKNGSLLKGRLNVNGYLMVALSYHGRSHPRTVHSLIADTFIGPRRGLDTRHLDGNRTNNRLSNLTLGSRADNMADAKRHGTLRPVRSEDSGMAKLTVEQAKEIRLSNERGDVLAERFGVSIWTVSDIRSGQTWKDLSVPVAMDRQRGANNPYARLTDEAVLDIRSSSLSGKVLADKYGVCRRTVDKARRGETWPHVQLLTDPIAIEGMYTITHTAEAA